MYLVSVVRRTDDNEWESEPIDKTEDPFYYRLTPDKLANLDPSWEHSDKPILIQYDEIEE